MEEHDKLADQYEQDADRMDELTDQVGRDVQHNREDWDSKKKAEGVPGAVKTPEEKAEENAEERNEFDLEETEDQP